jgi:hypothetical protein
MTLSDRISAMYSRSASHLAEHEDKAECGLKAGSCKIRFLPELILPDYGPIHEPVVGAPATTPILKRTASEILQTPATPTAAPAGALSNSDDRFLRELRASKISSDRRRKAVSKLQARFRGIIQRRLHEQSIQATKDTIRAKIEQTFPKEKTLTSTTPNFQEFSDEIQRLEMELTSIDRQHQDELKQIECWKAEEMKRIHEEAEAERYSQNSSQLSAEVKSNHRRIRALRRERKQFLEDSESLRKDLEEIREEHCLLLMESAQLQERAKSVQQYIDTATKRNDDWSKSSMQYEVHVAHVQTMIDEREALTDVEANLKNLYGRTVVDLAQLLGGQVDVVDGQELEHQMDSIDSANTLLYAA